MIDLEVRISRLAWSWIIQVLASHDEVELQLLSDLIQSVPELSGNLNEDSREVIALRNLDSLFDPANVSNIGVHSPSDQEVQFDPESFRHALKCVMDQPSMPSLRMDGENLLQIVRKRASANLVREVQNFIERNKASIPICALQKLSDKLQRGNACHETDLEREKSCLKTQELTQDSTVEAHSGELPPEKKSSDMQELSDVLQNGDACHEIDMERESNYLKTQELLQNSTVEAQSDKSSPKTKLIYDNTGSIASAEKSTSPVISSDMQDCPIDDLSDKLLPRKKRRHNSSGSDPSLKLNLASSISSDMQDCPVDDQSDKLLSVKKRRDNDNGSVPCTELRFAPSISSDMQGCPVDPQCDLSSPGKKLRHDSKDSSFSEKKSAEKNCPVDCQSGKLPLEKNQNHDNSSFIASIEKNSDPLISSDINQPNPLSAKPAQSVSQLKWCPSDVLIEELRKNAENSSTHADDSELDICIKCHEGGEVLICRGSSCPVVVHERCLGITESIESRDNFLCPFCVCSLANSEYAEAKERMFVARDKLTLFVGGNIDNRPEKNMKINANPPRQAKQQDEHLARDNVHSSTPKSLSKQAEGIKSSDCQDNRQFTNANPSSSRKSRDKWKLKGKSVNQAAQALTDNQYEVRLAQENTVRISPSNSIPANSCQTERRFVLVSAFPPTNQQQDDLLAPDYVHDSTDKQASIDEKGNDVHQAHLASADKQQNIHLAPDNVDNSPPNPSLKEGEDGTAKNSQLEKGDKTIPIENFHYAGSSPGVGKRQQLDRLSKNASFRPSGNLHGSPGSNSQTAKISDNFLSPNSKRKLADLQGAYIASLGDTDVISEEETSGATASGSPQRFRRVGRKSYRPNRIPWTDEEVEMLKEGVKRYGSGDVQVIPWSMILEFGSSVFWKGRTGVNLKDKWRNLLKSNPGLR